MDGALLLDKPLGVSSNRVLQDVKKIFGARKAGHAGTLDPLATGLLLVLFGEATKFAAPLLDADKEYLATLKLESAPAPEMPKAGCWRKRRSRSRTAQCFPCSHASWRSRAAAADVLGAQARRCAALQAGAARRDGRAQSPPSADLELERLAFESPALEIRVRCSKGTYIRTLAEEIGNALGTGAHLTALRRTSSGPFRVADALTLEALTALQEAGRRERLLPLGALVGNLPQKRLDAGEEARFRKGQALSMPGLAAGSSRCCGPMAA